jgi:hypothetical protein
VLGGGQEKGGLGYEEDRSDARNTRAGAVSRRAGVCGSRSAAVCARARTPQIPTPVSPASSRGAPPPEWSIAPGPSRS